MRLRLWSRKWDGVPFWLGADPGGAPRLWCRSCRGVEWTPSHGSVAHRRRLSKELLREYHRMIPDSRRCPMCGGKGAIMPGATMSNEGIFLPQPVICGVCLGDGVRITREDSGEEP